MCKLPDSWTWDFWIADTSDAYHLFFLFATLAEPLVVADPESYSTVESGGDEPRRDLWVFQDESGLWHMLVTARAAGSSDVRDSGVVGHATSEDLEIWKVGPPVTDSGHGFGQFEVPQMIETESGHVLIFSCLNGELADRRRTPGGGGVWVAPATSSTGPFDLERAVLITDSSRYAGRVVRDRAGALQLLAFRNVEDGTFIGCLADPFPSAPCWTRLPLRRRKSNLGNRKHHRFPRRSIVTVP